MLQHCSGRSMRSASREMAMVLELVASTACRGASRSRRPQSSRLASRFSKMASITRSAPVSAVARSVPDSIAASDASPRSRVVWPRSTARSTSLRLAASARPTWAQSASTRATR